MENKGLRSQLRADEALVVENAVRLAIESVLNVLYGVTSGRTREYQHMVADRDKEIRRLEARLTELERELQVLRRRGCACAMFEGRSRISGTGRPGEESGVEGGGGGGGGGAEQPECDVSLAVDLYARPPSHASSQNQDFVPASSPSQLSLGLNGTSRSSEASGLFDGARTGPPSPPGLVVKEEPCDIDAVLIKWEMSEATLAGGPEPAGAPHQDQGNSGGTQRAENSERRSLRENFLFEAHDFQMSAGEQLRNRRKNVPMSELPEEAQRLRRAAWRAASKRYYARKMARQRNSAQRSGPGQRSGPPRSLALQPGGFADPGRRWLSLELPGPCYDHKAAPHQAEGVHLLMDTLSPSRATQGPNGEGPQIITGGIMCS